MWRIFGLSLLLCGCMSTWVAPVEFIQQSITAPDFEIFTYQKTASNTQPIHIYIEGDGHAFDARGIPTHDPTPHNTFHTLGCNSHRDSIPYNPHLVMPFHPKIEHFFEFPALFSYFHLTRTFVRVIVMP